MATSCPRGPDPTPERPGLSTEKLNLIGAIVAYVIYLSSIAVFMLRLTMDDPPEHWAGAPLLLMALPLTYLLVTAPSAGRSALYYVQIGLVLAWLAVLFVVDYYPGYEFRGRLPAVIGFVTLYFAGMGGMIGVASLAGRAWSIGAVALFLIAGTLAFVARWVTGV